MRSIVRISLFDKIPETRDAEFHKTCRSGGVMDRVIAAQVYLRI
ncbi:LysR family transcriptional regulator, partial [Klebsiella pneumoniae]